MRYIIANKALASIKGFSIDTHRINGNLILLNEKEVANAKGLQGNTIEERIEPIAGTVYSASEVLHVLNEGGWNEL